MKKSTIWVCLLLTLASCTQTTQQQTNNNSVDSFNLTVEELTPQPIASSKAILNTNQIPSQKFEINPTKPKTITGKEGTTVSIPANAFINSKGEVVTDNVEIELKEVMTKLDMVKSGLSTVTNDGKLLESGGMFYINATCEGEELALANGKVLDINVPSAKADKEMMLWEGEEVNGEMVWKNPRDIEIESFGEAALDIPSEGEWEEPQGEMFGSATSNTIIEQGEDVFVGMNITPKTAIIQTFENCIATYCLVDEVRKDTFFIVPDEIAECDYEMLTKKEKEGLYARSHWNDKFMSKLRDSVASRKEQGLTPNDVSKIVEPEPIKVNVPARGPVVVQMPGNNQPFGTTTENQQTVKNKSGNNMHVVSETIGYKLQQNKLGWSNIDRYSSGNTQLCELDLAIKLNMLSDSATFDLCLISKSRNFYIPGYRKASGLFGFTHSDYEKAARMPVGEKALILAVFKDGDKTYIGSLNFTIKQKAIESLSLQEVADGKLDKELDKVLN